MKTDVITPNTKISQLLKKASINAVLCDITACTNGGNNRTYKVTTDQGEYIVKHYFNEREDQRDRLTAEYAFLSYARSRVPHWVPKPYCFDRDLGMALYEYVQGQPLSAATIGADDVRQAADFFCALNTSLFEANAFALPNASEAVFSIQAHLELVANRIARLCAIPVESAEDLAAAAVVQQLNERWQAVRHRVLVMCLQDHMDVEASLPLSQRCVSPSDFGFHNALRLADGSLRFLDFEYAGWDDPAKMVGDFFAQLAVPVSPTYFQSFTQQVMQPFEAPDALIRRATLLRPVYQIKWCCIALNIFMPVHLSRRLFAQPTLNVRELKLQQLNKATNILQTMEFAYDDNN